MLVPRTQSRLLGSSSVLARGLDPNQSLQNPACFTPLGLALVGYVIGAISQAPFPKARTP